MNKKAFKQRMQNLKSYRELNPDKGYWEWRNSLPDNLKYTDDTEYDMIGAYNSGALPILSEDGFYHLPTRDPKTGKILKRSIHPTYWKGLAEDERMGYHAYWLPDGSTYTVSKEDAPILAYLHGGEANKSGIISKVASWVNNLYKNQPAVKQPLGLSIVPTKKQKESALKRQYANSLRLLEGIVTVSNSGAFTADGDVFNDIDNYGKPIGEIPEEHLFPANTFFMPLSSQKEVMARGGFDYVGSNKDKKNLVSDYKLVNKATRRLIEKYNKEIPLYIANPKGYLHLRYTGDEANLVPIQRSNKDYSISNNSNAIRFFYDPGSFATALYVDKTNGNLYTKSWDLNDYGGEDGGASSAYDKIQLFGANLIDRFGTPFVVSTPYLQFDENKISNLSDSTLQLIQKTRETINKYSIGGETKESDNFTSTINTKLGRTPSGRPIEQGLKSVFDLRDATNFTPIGDVLAAKDTYTAIKNNDWLGASLAGIGMLPFVPSVYKKINKISRPIPEVHKNTLDLIDNKLKELDKIAEDKSKFANEQYRIVERVMEDPSYIARAEQVKKQFGDDYMIPYADMFMAYNVDPNVLPQVQLLDDLRLAGTMGKTADGKFVYGRNPDVDVPNVGEHEISHFTDLLKSGKSNAEAGNNMFYQMSKDLNKKVDENDRYFSNPSELKAHMNQLREWMFENNIISDRNEKISTDKMKDIINGLDSNGPLRGVKRASKQFKSNKTYTKWFNSIPLISAAALPMNRYFSEDTLENKK